MTENNGNDRRRNIKGRIDTLGTGTNGVSGRRTANRVGDRLSQRRTNDEKTADASLADEEEPAEDDAETADEEEIEAEEAEADVESESDVDTEEFSTEEEDEFGEDADADDAEDAEADGPEDDADDDVERETRASGADKHSTLEIEIDPFVRAYAARRAVEKGDESLDEYIVGSVKGYLAGLLGGDVSSPGTLKREVEVEADPIFGGLLETIADDDESAEDVVIDAVAEAYDVPVDEETLAVAGLRDHEALLNGVVANSSNDLDDVSEVVQAAVETRLIEEPA